MKYLPSVAILLTEVDKKCPGINSVCISKRKDQKNLLVEAIVEWSKYPANKVCFLQRERLQISDGEVIFLAQV